LSVIFVDFYIIDMSQTLNSVPAYDGTNYGYWKARMRFFLKSIDCLSIVETGWTKPADATLEVVTHMLFPKFAMLLWLIRSLKSLRIQMVKVLGTELPNFKC
jgi:hypothetical protein